ncbi:MAG: Eco57I restriction-modification methylase domain-containing protein [Aureliella sp.]
MPSLTTTQRRRLEKAVEEARREAEAGAREALEALTVHEAKRGGHVDTSEKISLRNRLRAHGRFLGDRRDANGSQAIDRLVEECAYQHWHRILFARFLAENDCLWHPELRALVSLEEVEELAHEEGTHKWELAGRFARRALPAIFPADNPVLEVELPRERLNALIELVEDPTGEDDKSGLPRSIFQADDSLGWVYQFWQNDANEAANKSEEKIDASTLPAVTQFFTEDYMVLFLLHNTLGAWHAGKVLAARPELAQDAKDEDELRRAVALEEAGGYEFEYLRFVREAINSEDDDAEPTGPWKPMGGAFEGWPRTAAELKVLDPCCGSGHFLVAAFELLVRLRMHEESLSLPDAIDAVFSDNLFGLEIDKRCVQIAVFNIALSAWKLDSYRDLTSMMIAHVGQSIGATRADWMSLLDSKPHESGSPAAELANQAQEGLGFFWGQLYDMFSQASTLGSLLSPRRSLTSFLLSPEQTKYLYDLLEAAVAADPNTEPDSYELGLTAKGLATATRLLGEKYNLVLTNVPFLGRNKQPNSMQAYSDAEFPLGKADLSVALILRCVEMCGTGGTAGIVSPQNWHFLNTYRKLREYLLDRTTWNFAAKLGPAAFVDMNWWAANTGLVAISASTPVDDSKLSGVDVSPPRNVKGKSDLLLGKTYDGHSSPVDVFLQSDQRANAASRIVFRESSSDETLGEYAECLAGINAGDINRFFRGFWELSTAGDDWEYLQNSFRGKPDFGGMSSIVLWQGGTGDYYKSVAEKLGESGVGAWIRGAAAWGRPGIAIVKMRDLQSTLYIGDKFGANVYVIVPKDAAHVAPIFVYSRDPSFLKNCRQLDQKTDIANQTVLDIPFDLSFWNTAANEKYPNGLPEPESNDPSQWLFHGWPSESTSPLQVSVSRLLGYRWPSELDSEMRLSDRARELVGRCVELASFVDDDGIVCIPSVRGEEPAADRLARLLAACGVSTSENLDDWLRNKFFKEHCDTFDQRPFIWHIYDGRKQDGFHALVNYHKLAGPDGHKLLESLTYSYLGEWIDRQKDEVKRELPGATDRLTAAEDLFKRLEAIAEGEPPFDLFIRWKPLHEQPIGWHPDINDGVRMNIRPFMADDLPGVPKGAGVFRVKPKIKWTKDRGKEPERDKQDYPWLWSWDEKATDFAGNDAFNGVRWNDCHYTIAAKQKARESFAARRSDEVQS